MNSRTFPVKFFASAYKILIFQSLEAVPERLKDWGWPRIQHQQQSNATPKVALTMDGCTKNKPSASNIPVRPCPQPNVPTEQADA